jgi:threonine/homoserine/homoserine lactone efflux protein
MFHTLAATVGLSLLIQNSPAAFWVVKAVGAVYLLWLGYKALASGNLISFEPTARLPLSRVFLTGMLSNVLNPKPGLFVLAFLPQFVDASRGPVQVQMLVYGAIFAVLTALIFTAMGSSASKLANWLSRRPRVIKGRALPARRAKLVGRMAARDIHAVAHGFESLHPHFWSLEESRASDRR